MRKERFPVTSRRILGLLISCASKTPGAVEGLALNVVIRTIRNALRMTQAQLAKRAGMPQSHLAKIETGKVDVQLNTVRNILRAMFCETVVLPKFQKTPEAAVAERIKEVARQRVARATGTKNSEGRHPGDKTIRNLVRSEEERLMRQSSSEIWQEPSPALNPGEGFILRDRPSTKLERAQMPVRIVNRHDDSSDLKFWLGKSPEERVDAVEFLREQYYALSGCKSLPRLAHVLQVRRRQS